MRSDVFARLRELVFAETAPTIAADTTQPTIPIERSSDGWYCLTPAGELLHVTHRWRSHSGLGL